MTSLRPREEARRRYETSEGRDVAPAEMYRGKRDATLGELTEGGSVAVAGDSSFIADARRRARARGIAPDVSVRYGSPAEEMGLEADKDAIKWSNATYPSAEAENGGLLGAGGSYAWRVVADEPEGKRNEWFGQARMSQAQRQLREDTLGTKRMKLAEKLAGPASAQSYPAKEVLDKIMRRGEDTSDITVVDEDAERKPATGDDYISGYAVSGKPVMGAGPAGEEGAAEGLKLREKAGKRDRSAGRRMDHAGEALVPLGEAARARVPILKRPSIYSESEAVPAAPRRGRAAEQPLPDGRSVHMRGALAMLGVADGKPEAAPVIEEAPAKQPDKAVELRLLAEDNEKLKAEVEDQQKAFPKEAEQEPVPQVVTGPAPVAEEDELRVPIFKLVPVNPWVMAAADRFSTFGLDVDVASYAIARNYIRSGYLPPPGSVRMEEFVNAFDYNYPQQTQNIFTIHAEAADAPFGRKLKLLKIGVRGKVLGREARKRAHLVFVIDASGSMARPDRMPLVQYALKTLTSQLAAQDRVSLITYGTHARLVLEAVPAEKKDSILEAIDAVRCGGSTNLIEGLKLGYSMAEKAYRTGEINRVILCSDGVANVGATEAGEMLQNVELFRNHGITFTAAGFGAGAYNDVLMEQLANKGDGNYVFVDSQAEARRVFVEEMAATLQTIAKDVKIQVAFNPTRVRRYRLIGFENRDIADQDFRNDAIDAAEVGSGQSSTALYELELLPLGRIAGRAPDLGTVFVRYRNLETDKVEEISHRLAESIIRKRTPQTSPRFYLAACAAEFAEILRESEHAKDGSLDELRRVMEEVAAELPLDARAQELLWLVKKAKGLPKAK